MKDALLLSVQVFFIGYFLLLNGFYLVLNISSMLTLRSYMRRRPDYGSDAPYLDIEPPVTVVMPAYNEEATILAAVRSMLQLQYPDYELLIVNDGSKDNTLQVLIDEYDFVLNPEVVRKAVEHQPIRAVYRSRQFPNVRLVDKANGGKADALNAGINLARHDLFCAVDADSILQRDSLLRVVQPFVEDERTIASGGTVRIANGSEVRGGFLVKAGLPRNWLARMQIIEYLRAFLFGRLGWSSVNGVLIVSGAFGLFDRARVEAVGGYRPKSMGEDMELIMRLHEWHSRHRVPYRITYVPDPICWTECPEDFRTLGNQRSRWQRGLAESLVWHPPWRSGWRAGAAGWLAWPFMFLFELVAPLIEAAGYLVMTIGLILGWVSLQAMLLFLAAAIGMGILLSVNALLLETLSFRVYERKRDLLALFVVAVAENFGYRQINTWWRCRGMWQWMSRRKMEWGAMKRSGAWSSD